MEGNRVGALILQAAARGLIDFSHIDPRKDRDRFKVRLLITEIQKQNELRLYDMLHRQIVSQLSNSNLGQESLHNVWEAANSVYDRSHDLDLPWLKGKEETAANKEKSKYAGLKESWANAFGDPDDPVIKAQIDATSRWLTESDGPSN